MDRAAAFSRWAAGFAAGLADDREDAWGLAARIEGCGRRILGGWRPLVVTNGTVRQQERKLRHTGLAGHVAGWVISEGAGVRKPDPRVFRLAAEQAGLPLAGAWVVGDSAEADIGGARNAGLPSVWLHRDRAWPYTDFAPTLTAGTCPRAIAEVIARSGPAS